MSAPSDLDLAHRKALLTTRSSLDRMRLTLAVREIQSAIAPTQSAETLARSRGTASTLVGFALPLVGTDRLSRWLRVATLALTAFRIARHWRRY
jgi:hypothetical protein